MTNAEREVSRRKETDSCCRKVFGIKTFEANGETWIVCASKFQMLQSSNPSVVYSLYLVDGDDITAAGYGWTAPNEATAIAHDFMAQFK